jgi:type I restriction enzyme S subunit
MGEVCMIPVGLRCCLGQRMVLLRPNSAATEPRYLLFAIQSASVQEAIRSRGGTGSIVANLRIPTLAAIQIAAPPLQEQQLIADSLSAAVALIESLEQLIAKKRDLKQGAAQELLLGKKRLLGFSGKWEERSLGDLGTWKGGMTPSMENSAYWERGTIPWISSGDVKSVLLKETGSLVTEVAVKQGKTTLLPPKCLVVVTRSGILRKYLPVAMNVVSMAINQDLKALIPHAQYDPFYLLQLLAGNSDRILASCMKSGTTVESIEFSWLKRFPVPMPEIEEQTAIAAVLSDMDAEIAALEAKLAKARQIKGGMMQNLLTGKIRLV